MIVATIAGVAVVGSAGLASRLVELMQTAQMRADILELNEVFLSTVSNPRTCRNAFAAAPAFNLAAAQQANGQPMQMAIAPPNDNLGTLRDPRLAGNAIQILQGHKVGLAGLAFTFPNQIQSAPGPFNFYNANLTVAFVPTRNDQLVTTTSVEMHTRTIASITIKTDAVGRIVECGVIGTVTDPAKFCAEQDPSKVYVRPFQTIQAYPAQPAIPAVPASPGNPGVTGYPGHPAGPTHTADENGCINADVFRARPGLPGNPISGPTGQTGDPAPYPGPPGPQGPPGEDGYQVIFSDKRVKTELRPFQYGLEALKQVRPIWFEYNGLAGTTEGEKHAGVIAQELEQIAPELVEKRAVPLRNGEAPVEVRAVRYSEMDMMLIRSIQDQQKQIDDLKARLKK